MEQEPNATRTTYAPDSNASQTRGLAFLDRPDLHVGPSVRREHSCRIYIPTSAALSDIYQSGRRNRPAGYSLKLGSDPLKNLISIIARSCGALALGSVVLCVPLENFDLIII